jgi:DNA-binding beta-propeller fold protein YncE
MKAITQARVIAVTAVLSFLFGICGPGPIEVKAQSGKPTVDVPQMELDPYWPKHLPNKWIFGQLGAVCVDANDHIFVMSRGDLWTKEEFIVTPAPPVIEFNPEGDVVNSWGDRATLPDELHGCFFDKQGNFWTAGSGDGIVQEYTHDGKLLLQVGTKGKFDSVDGTDTRKGAHPKPLNSSHTSFASPTDVAVDSTNGDFYVSDGYGNKRVAVFDKKGQFLRQWGRQGTTAEVDAGVGGIFVNIVHCVVIGNDGLVYVCDRNGDRVEIFDKMGNYKRSINVSSSTGGPHYKGPGGTCWVSFSRDLAQKLMYISDCSNDEIHIVDRATGVTLANIGHPGQAAGDISSPHSIAIDSKGNLYVAGSLNDRRLQKFKVVSQTEHPQVRFATDK